MRLDAIKRKGLLIYAASGVLALALWGGIAYALRSAEQDAIARANVTGRNLARSLAEHVASSVRALDLVLFDLQAEWFASDLPFPEHLERLRLQLAQEQVSQVLAVDADGRVTYGNFPGAEGRDVSERPFFKVHKERGERGLHIGAPEFDADMTQWTIKFSRPIYDPSGGFGGVLALSLPPPVLNQIYDDIELGAGSIISLVRADGRIMAHSQDLDYTSGVSLAVVPGLAADAPPFGSYRRKSLTDGTERLYAYQRVPGYPLTVFVGQAVDTVLAPYVVQRASYAASGVLATLLLLIITLLLVSRLRSREQAERLLQERIAHLQLVYDTSSAAIFDVDAAGVITHANRRMAEMFGCSLESLVGSEYLGHLHPAEREEGRQAMFALISGKTEKLDLERRYCREDGSEFWGHVTGRCIVDASGNITDWVGVIADITQTRRAVEALKRNETHLRELFDNFPIAVAHISKAEYLTFANRVYREVYGDDYQGRSVREFVGDEVYELYEPYIRRALAGEVVEYERSMPGGDGEPGARLLRYVPDRDEKGEVTGFFVLREDITARRRAEERIQKLNEDLERRVSERTAELSAANAALQAEVKERQAAETAALNLAGRLQSMARRLGEAQELERRRLAAELHDGVCSNLAAIGLNLSLLKRQLEQSDSDTLRRRLSDLISQVDEAKANAKDISVDLRPLLLEERDLRPALEEYARKFADSTGIAVEVTGENPGRQLSAEKKIALFRIMQEALTNCARHARASAVAVKFDAGPDRLLLSVSDDGVGIDLSGIGARRTGLGLLSMQERAEAIGGRWRIESTPGKGTRISVSVGAALA